MDNATRFIDTLGAIASQMTELQKHIDKLGREVTKVSQTLARGDVKDRETRVEKLACVKVVTEELQNFVSFVVSQPVFRQYGALETFHTILDEKENDMWVVRSSGEKLTAAQTVDHLTDAITDYLTKHNDDRNPPKAAFVDNPDSFVSDFVGSYLDHPVTDRMSDMIISLVTDWMSFRLSE